MEKWTKRSIDFITGLALTGKKNPSVVPYKAAKTEISGKENKYFRRERPERHGVSSLLLYAMLGELEAEARANIHSLIVIKDGAVICECSREGYGVNTRHLAHSMSKTVMGLAVGFLVDEGRLDLDTPVVELLPEYRCENEHKLFHKISVRHLLTMSSFVKFSEAGSVTEADWCRAFFSSEVTEEPGSGFKYNSMNSYILAVIVSKIAGMGISEFLESRLFEPLGIKNYFWEKSSTGIEKGGWGLHMSVESWAKIGVMMLGRGRFGKERILSERWIAESTRPHAETSETLGDFNYGYHLWVERESDEFLFSGMLGQNVWVCPKNNIVAVISSGNNELFQVSPALSIIRRFLSEDDLMRVYSKDGAALLRAKEARFFDSRRWVNHLTPQRGLKYLLGFADARPYDSRWDRVLGKYTVADNNHGVLPVFIRVMQNNFLGGIESFEIAREGGAVRITFTEGGHGISFTAGFYEPHECVLDFGGEKYIAAASAVATVDSEGQELYKIELNFVEMPNSRQIRLYPDGKGQIRVVMTETPNEKLVEPFLDMIADSNKKISLGIDFIKRKFGKDYIEKKIKGVFSPELLAVSEKLENCRDIISAEEAAIGEQINVAKSLASMISRIVGSDEGEEQAKSSIFSNILGFFMK